MFKNIKKDFVRAAKILIIASIIGVGTVYALNYTDPLTSPVSCPDGNTGCSAPLNVGSSTQIKTGQLDIQGGLLVEGVSVFSPNNIEIGDTTHFPTLKIFGLNQDNNDGVNDPPYPAPLCADSEGYLVVCDGPGLPTVDLTVDTTTITTSEVTSISQAVNLTWTTTNMVGGTCVGTQNNGATGFTGTPSYAGGTDGATVEKFGTTTFTITCTPTVGDPVTDTATVLATGYKTYTSGTTFTPASAEFNSGTVFTIKALGGGGGGASYGGSVCPGGDCSSLDGGSGTQTTVTKGTIILTATAGTGGYYNNDVNNGASDAVPGTAGSGSSGHTQGYSFGNYTSNQNCGAGAIQIQYGEGGSPGCNAVGNAFGGAGAAQSVTNTWTSGSYTYSLGAGGAHGGTIGSAGGLGQDGGKGAVRFEW